MTHTIKTIALMVAAATLLTVGFTASAQPFFPGAYNTGGFINTNSSAQSGGYQNNYATPFGSSSNWGNYSNSQTSANWGNYGVYNPGFGGVPFQNGGFSNTQTSTQSNGFTNNWATPGASGSSWGTSFTSSTSSNWGSYGTGHPGYILN